jgi:hypothetical protein
MFMNYLRRQLWAWHELASCLVGTLRIITHTSLVWGVGSNAKTREERLADVDAQIGRTPFGLEYAALDRRVKRAMLAICYPKLDSTLLKLMDRTKGNPQLNALMQQVADAVLDRYFWKSGLWKSD